MDKASVTLFWFLFTFAAVGAAICFGGGFSARNRVWPAWSIKVAEILTAVLGVTGAFLFALKVYPTWGFMAYLLSNLAAIPFNRHQGNRWILVQQQCFLVSSLLGLWNFAIEPLVRG